MAVEYDGGHTRIRITPLLVYVKTAIVDEIAVCVLGVVNYWDVTDFIQAALAFAHGRPAFVEVQPIEVVTSLVRLPGGIIGRRIYIGRIGTQLVLGVGRCCGFELGLNSGGAQHGVGAETGVGALLTVALGVPQWVSEDCVRPVVSVADAHDVASAVGESRTGDLLVPVLVSDLGNFVEDVEVLDTVLVKLAFVGLDECVQVFKYY